MTNILDIVSLVAVGAFWGCTNPWLRKGSLEVKTTLPTNEEQVATKKNKNYEQEQQQRSLPLFLLASIKKFRDFRVWLPYVLNQTGSVVYYALLANSDLTLAVPICNGLALVFSCITSYLLGERVDKPFQAVLGAISVMLGVALCMAAQDENKNEKGMIKSLCIAI